MTVDQAFVLGSDELYREWGYTALSRHRDSARFYVSATPRFLNAATPALEAGLDATLLVRRMLEPSRAQDLALAHRARDPLEAYAQAPERPRIDGRRHDKDLASSAEMASVGDPLLTTRQVAALFNVDRGWVAHANELGVVRIGTGPRPRIRFDPAVVARLMLPARGRTAATPASYRTGADVTLLPIRPARPRSLGAQR